MKLAGYDEALQQGEDGEFLLRLCAAGRVALRAGQPVALTTIHKHNTSRPENRKYWHNIEALRHLYRNLRRMGASKEVAVVKKCVSGKLDYLLTRIKVEELRYFERLRSGAIHAFTLSRGLLNLEQSEKYLRVLCSIVKTFHTTNMPDEAACAGHSVLAVQIKTFVLSLAL